MKKCNRCKKRKPLEGFYKDKRSKDGLQYYCKKCCKSLTSTNYVTNRDKRVAYMAKWRRENPKKYEEVRQRAQAKRLGVSIEEIRTINDARTGKCMICRKPWKPGMKRLAVDHCHKTGRVRGVLCAYCNRGLGQFYDDVGLLRAAITYLETK